MNYLKLVNCPVRGLFPEINGKIDWKGAGFDVTQVGRFTAQGFDAVGGDYVSVFPIDDEGKLVASGVIDKTNSNDNQSDTAEIINETAADSLKVVILAVRESQGTELPA